jgi:poly(3-hydroxyalkanoate) synthetase
MITPTTCPPSVSQSALAGSVEATLAATSGWTDYVLDATRRGAGPARMGWEVSRWWAAMLDRRPPEWSTAHEIVWETPIVRLRDFSQGSRARVVPTLVLPPQAGHSSCIVDYSPEQSQMQTIRAAGLEQLYSLDWVGATQATKHTTVDDYLAVMERAVDEIGGPVNLVGDCQGGWLATIYAALHPEDVNTLTIGGAPIDFHAGDPVIGGYVEVFEPTFYQGLVAGAGGVLKGEYLLGGFVAIKPQDEVGRQLELLKHIGESEHTERYAHFENWFKHTQDLSGDFYLWVVEHLFRRNALVRGELEIGGERVDLGRISCPLNLLAGAEDHITPPPQVFAAADFVATKESDVCRRQASGGHLGLFMGRESLRDHWPPVMAEVLAHSRPAADKPTAAKRARRATPAGTPPELPAP